MNENLGIAYVRLRLTGRVKKTFFSKINTQWFDNFYLHLILANCMMRIEIPKTSYTRLFR